jgi:hypothetical protein
MFKNTSKRKWRLTMINKSKNRSIEPEKADKGEDHLLSSIVIVKMIGGSITNHLRLSKSQNKLLKLNDQIYVKENKKR